MGRMRMVSWRWDYVGLGAAGFRALRGLLRRGRLVRLPVVQGDVKREDRGEGSLKSDTWGHCVHCVHVHPFEGNFTRIEGIATPKMATCPEGRYTVSWPSIGSQDTETARQFALSILTACAWVDEQKRQHDVAEGRAS